MSNEISIKLQDTYLSTDVLTSLWNVDDINLKVIDGTLCAVGFDSLGNLAKKDLTSLTSDSIVKNSNDGLDVAISAISSDLNKIFQSKGDYSSKIHTHNKSQITEISDLTFKSLASCDYSDISDNIQNDISNFTIEGSTESDNKKLGESKLLKFRATYGDGSSAEGIYFYALKK